MLLLVLLRLLIFFSFEFVRYFEIWKRGCPLQIHLGLFVQCYEVRKTARIDTIKYTPVSGYQMGK